MRPRQMQCRTILFCRLPLRAARHSLSAAQEKVRCSLRIQKLRSSAVPLRRLRTWQAHSQQQNIRLHRLLRDLAWQENSQLPIRQRAFVLLRTATPQELVRGHNNRAVRRIRPRPARQERNARPSADAIPSPCSRQRAFPRVGTPRSRSRIMFLPSSPTARRSQPAESVWMAAPQIGSILRLQRRYLRQCRLPTAKLVHPHARPLGLMRRIRQNSALHSAQFPHKAAAQKSRRRKMVHMRLLPLHLPTGRAGNRLPQLLWAA